MYSIGFEGKVSATGQKTPRGNARDQVADDWSIAFFAYSLLRIFWSFIYILRTVDRRGFQALDLAME